ncbi:hypothetical protein ACE6H2_007068 [Prunus campanulata]
MGNTCCSRVPKQPPPIILRMPTFPKCHVCNSDIERWDDSRQLTFWGSEFCKIHLRDGTPWCSGCERFKTQGQRGYVNLEDGRKLCEDCESIAIFDPSKCNRLIEKMREFYEELNLQVDKDIPILLVDKHYMDKWQGKGCSWIDHIRSQKSLGGCKNLDARVREGICEVMAYLWLGWFCDERKNNLDSYTTEQATFTKDLKTFCVTKMSTRDDDIYGNGFREAWGAVEKSNLHKTLQHIVQHKTLPPQIHSNSTC